MISVIIPVYNAQKFLRQCLESVLMQKFSDFEVIAVNDGSTDSSGAILDEVAAEDTRLRVIHTANGGLSSARNIGIDAACGEWLTFVDADDMLLPQALRRMWQSLESVGTDACDAAIYRWEQGKEAEKALRKALSRRQKSASTLSGFRAAEAITYREKGLEPSACAKLLRRKLFEGLRFTVGTWYEDVDFTYRLMLRARKVLVSSESVYFYREQPESFMHVWSEGRRDIIAVTDRMLEWCAANCPALLPAARDRRFSANFNIFSLAVRTGDNALARTCWEVIRDYRSEVLHSKKTRLKNRLGAILSYAGRRGAAFVARFVG